ncbi:hypothetical protein OF83DRAFT_826652 [Amylostereum chailletii]|nr:hypothetical protein OF83DRAFT_826652 [Amylostereum chailletii]
MPSSPSPDAGSSSLPSSTTSNDEHRHKGKLTRSWPQLPPELIRMIATHFLFELSVSTFVPHTWSTYGFWPGRAMYTTYQNAHEMARLMKICPEWATAIEHHHFWNYACSMVDPHDLLFRRAFPQNNASSAVSTRQSDYYHYHSMAPRSCHICRINHPDSTYGLLTAKRTVRSFTLGCISVCKDHKRSTYCGVCLRDQPSYAPDMTEALIHFGLSENEDVETWPDISMTCRSCRSEWLWRNLSSSESDSIAVGGGPPHWAAPDIETRMSIDYFLDSGEGTIRDVTTVARERYWLHEYTRMDDYIDEVVAAQRLGRRSGSAYDDETMDQDLDEDMEEDDRNLNAQAMVQVRDMAITDWARTRILDGYWITPADEWFKLRRPSYPARHPAPWALETGDADPSHPTVHPNPDFVHRIPTAPTYTLAELLHRTYQRQLRQVLAPAMHNVVKRLKWQARGDPAVDAARMDVNDVLRELQQAYAWSKDLRAESLPPPPAERTKDDESSSKSDTSHGSHTTSPVLSTTTLQTTPSPPPREDQEKEDGTETVMAEPISPIDMSGVVPPDPSNLLHSIPYVPVTLVDAPKFIVELINTVSFTLFLLRRCAGLLKQTDMARSMHAALHVSL